jgi:hypothetical protein
MSHVLVVGGTGMLRGATEHLRELHEIVSVVARTRSVPGTEALLLDWRDPGALEAALEASRRAHGSFEMALCWVHSSAPDAPRIVAEAVRPGTLYQVFGSAADSGNPVKRRWQRELSGLPGLDYRTILLGRRGARWLTDEEISRGVIEAVDSARRHHVVGEVDREREGERDGR